MFVREVIGQSLLAGRWRIGHAQPAAPLPVSAEQLAELRTWLRSSSIPAGLAQRARIVTLAAEGTANTEIAELAGCSRRR